MNKELSENEKRVLNILNYKDDINDIWTSVQELVNKLNMGLTDLELALYFLQMRRMVRVSIDEVGDIKITTEEKVNKKLGARINSALGGMQEAENDAVEDENYEEAAKFRDWIVMAKDPARQDELISKLLEDIDSEED